MKTIDEKEMQKGVKEKQTTVERTKGNRSYSETSKFEKLNEDPI